jgi:hypothetical protein
VLPELLGVPGGFVPSGPESDTDFPLFRFDQNASHLGFG